MKKENLIVLAALFLFLVVLGMGGGFAKNVVHLPVSSGNVAVTSFTVAQPALRTGERTSVRVSVRGDAHGALTYAWKAEAGELSAADANPVIWTAPESEGHYRVSVEVTDAAGGKSRGSAGLLVSKYPANPLITSVDPMAVMIP